MPKPKDYDTDMKPYWDYKRAKEYHKKFIWKLIPEEHQDIRDNLYDIVIDRMIDDYKIPNDFHCGDALPVIQPSQDSWAWNCMNYRVSKVHRPFILMTNPKWKNKGAT
jgi:hypothetical protein